MTPEIAAMNPDTLLGELTACWPGVRLGADIAEVSSVQASLDRFGEQYLRRVYLPSEVSSCLIEGVPCATRLAARFAAKEAVIKALDLATTGTSWLDIEVRRTSSGRCFVHLHGNLALQQGFDASTCLPVSLSHDGAFAIALVAFPPAGVSACPPTQVPSTS